MALLQGLTEIRATTDPERFARLPDAQCFVYEVWDTMHRLAYVGIADNFERRWRQHQRSSWWLGEIDIWYVDIFGYRSRHEARLAEACVINDQCPVYNTSQESSSFRQYQASTDNPRDDLDGVPVARQRYAGVPSAVV